MSSTATASTTRTRSHAITPTTTRGRALALTLARWIDTDRMVSDGAGQSSVPYLCSQIVMLADEYQRLAVDTCNRPLVDAERARESVLEDRLIALVARLPPAADGPLVAWFDGDPRGFVFLIHVPGVDAARYGNTLGQGGNYGVGEARGW